jgi:voltage-gated potassium channel
VVVIKLVLSALALTALTVIIHGVGSVACTERVVRLGTGRRDRPGQLGAVLLIAQLVSALLLLHLAEAVVWALFFVLVSALPDVETGAYFSLTSYTTVGYGDVVLPEPWRLLGPLEAAVGVLMLGWSTGILVAVIGMMYRQLFPSLIARGELTAGESG